ncbi:MAG: hypothetical protein JXR34_05890 [Bacteroidales bacterium]|nr:hypothetical protein [Bacteroidales bacterium]
MFILHDNNGDEFALKTPPQIQLKTQRIAVEMGILRIISLGAVALQALWRKLSGLVAALAKQVQGKLCGFGNESFRDTCKCVGILLLFGFIF